MRALLAHLLDLELAETEAKATDAEKADIARQKRAVVDERSAEFIDVCTNKTPKERVECALEATDLPAVAKCDEAK